MSMVQVQGQSCQVQNTANTNSIIGGNGNPNHINQKGVQGQAGKGSKQALDYVLQQAAAAPDPPPGPRPMSLSLSA